MNIVPIPFCGGSYSALSLNINAQRSVNFYPVIIKSLHKSVYEPPTIVMYPSPGKSLFTDLVGSSVRGAYEYNGTLYTVCDTHFYSVDTAGAKTSLGTLFTNAGSVSIQCNTAQIAISDGHYGYTYNLTSGAFANITDSNFPGAGVTNFAEHDGYMYGNINNSRRTIQSTILDASTWPALAYNDQLTFPDNLTGIFSDQREVFIHGRKGTEVRYDAGSTPFALEKVQNVTIQTGLAAVFSWAKIDNSFFWLTQDERGRGFVVRLNGYTPIIISTAAVNEAIQSYSTISDAIGFAYKEGNSQFYQLTFPTANVTWVYDASTNEWHEKSSFGIGRDIANCYAFFNGKHVIGDYNSGKLYYLSQDYLDEAGGIIQRIRTCQHQQAQGRVLFLFELWVDIEMGVGLNSGQGSEPLATLEISKDGGHTWVSYGTASMGKIGEYRRRMTWRPKCRARIFTFRLTISDPVRCYILGANAVVKVGSK